MESVLIRLSKKSLNYNTNYNDKQHEKIKPSCPEQMEAHGKYRTSLNAW